MRARNRLGSALCAITILVSLAGCAPGWNRSSFTLEDVLTNPDDTAFSSEEEATDALCGNVGGCIEGWTTDQADFLRFESNESANEFASKLKDDGYHSNRVVIDFERAQSSDEDKQLAIELIEGTHSST